MPSRALAEWKGRRSDELDQLLAAHAAVGGTGRGRRYATEQVNRAYALAVAAQFQGFCRDLHSEAVEELVAVTQPPQVAVQLRVLLTSGRQLDRGTRTPPRWALTSGSSGCSSGRNCGHVIGASRSGTRGCRS